MCEKSYLEATLRLCKIILIGPFSWNLVSQLKSGSLPSASDTRQIKAHIALGKWPLCRVSDIWPSANPKVLSKGAVSDSVYLQGACCRLAYLSLIADSILSLRASISNVYICYYIIIFFFPKNKATDKNMLGMF